jgi:hypothetical protein
VAAHATEITAMTQLDEGAGEVLGMLARSANPSAHHRDSDSVLLFRGIFLDDRRWNVTPASSGY